ncbi:MAG: hypothetical protein EOM92_20745 [Gammaproteobacteria bacterium]|nr:hypothetical protein [Gammaproteobacteria bacterium]
MTLNQYVNAARQFQDSVARIDPRQGEGPKLDAVCFDWLEIVLKDRELRAEREIGLQLLNILRGIMK